MTSQRRNLVARDQDTSPFSSILSRLCDATRALGASLVDCQGETVDYAGILDPFQVRVVAAEIRLLLSLLSQSENSLVADTSELVLRSDRSSFLGRPLTEGYAIVLKLPRRCFSVSPRAMSEAIRELCREGGLKEPTDRHQERWARVDVRIRKETKRRPDAIWQNGRWHPVEILGRFVRRTPCVEAGFRVRFESGAEATLVREPLGIWYGADLPGA